MTAALIPLVSTVAPTALATTAGTAAAATAAGSFIGPVTAAQSAAGTLSLLQPVFTGISVFGELAGGISDSYAYKAQAKQQQLQARAEEIKGKQQANAIRENLRRTIASQNAAFAARGISPQSGTPVVLGRESRAAAMNDIDIARFNSDIASMQGYAQAQQTKAKAKTALYSGVVRAGSLL